MAYFNAAPPVVYSRGKTLSQSAATVGQNESEVKFWKDKTAELSADPHKPPPTKVVPDDCPVHHEHHFWREHVTKLSSPTPGGNSIIDIHPPYGAGHDEEVDYWKNKMAELCLPVDQLVETDKGHQAARRRSFEHEEAMFFDKKRKKKEKAAAKAKPIPEDPVKSFAEFLALAKSASTDDISSSLFGLSAASLLRLRIAFAVDVPVPPTPPAPPPVEVKEAKPKEEPVKPKEEPVKPAPTTEPKTKLEVIEDQGNNSGSWKLNGKLSTRQEALMRASRARQEPQSEEGPDEQQRFTVIGEEA